MFQKHSYKTTVAYPRLCRTSRGYRGLSVVIFFWTHSFHVGGKGMCLCIIFVSWLPDLCSCLHIDYWMPSLCSPLQEWAKDYKHLGFSFPVCLCICACAWALSVCSHMLLCQLKGRSQVYIFTRHCHWAILQSRLRTKIYCVSGKINLRLELGGCVEAVLSQQSILPLPWIQNSLTKCVVGLSYLELSGHVCRDPRLPGINLNAVAMSCCSCLGPWQGGSSAWGGLGKPGMVLLQFLSPSGMDKETRGTEWATKPSYAQRWDVLAPGQLGGQGLKDLQRKTLL